MKNTKRKVQKFTELKNGQTFYLPNHQTGYESQFVKISSLLYGETITRQVWMAADGMTVDVSLNKPEK